MAKKMIFYNFAIVAAILFLFLNGADTAQAAKLRLSPSAGSFLVGSTFDLSIILDTENQSANFIEIELFFPPDKLQLASPSVGKSIIQLWPVSPVFSNQTGRIYFAGGNPDPGINTSDGLILTLTFRVTSNGQAMVKFGNKTSVLANDGKGTEILDQKSSAFFNLVFPPPLGPAISSPTHPDQTKWYRENNVVFVWPKSSGSEAYSFKINQDPGAVPDTIAESTESTASFSDLNNGIWYFHLREKANGVWGGSSLYVVKIDNEPPAQFRVNISPSAKTANRNPILRFFTTDALSGFSNWEIKIVPLSSGEVAQALFFGVDSPYQANLEPGRYQIIVRAIDKAGNTRDETATLVIFGAGSWLFDSEGVDLYFVFVPWRWIAFGAAIAFLIFFFVIARLWLQHKHHVAHAFREDIEKLFGFFLKPKK